MRNQKSFKYFLFTFNFVSLILALALIVIGLYIRFEWDLKEYIYGLEAFRIWTGPYIVMTGAGLAIFGSFFGCWASAIESRRFLFWFAVDEVLSAVLMISGATITLINGVYYSPLTDWLTDRFHELIYESAYNERAARTMRMIQEDVGCCAADSYMDYTEINMILPTECRDPMTGNVHELPCPIAFAHYIEPLTGWLAGIAIILFVFQVLAILVTYVLRMEIIKAEKHAALSYQPVHTSRT